MKKQLISALCSAVFPLSALALEDGEVSRILTEQQAQIQALESRLADRGSLSQTDFIISGYLNVGAGATSERSDNDPTYRGLDGDVNFSELTSGGLQVEALISDQLSGTVQFRANGSEEFDSELEWAYVRYQPSSSLTFKAGRMVAPIYMHSEYQTVGYSYDWISVPAEVYNSAPITNMQGISASLRLNTGTFSHLLNLSIGNQDVDQVLAGAPVSVQGDNVVSLNARSTMDNLSLWLGLSRVSIGLSLPDLSLAGGPDLSPYSDDGLVTLASAGLQYDDGSLVLNAEALELDSEINFIPNDRAGYVMAGYRFGRFLPSVTWAMATNDGFDELGPDPVLVSLYNSRAKEQKSWTFGLRADLIPKLALKAEIQSFYDLGDATQTVPAPPGLQTSTPSLWDQGVPDSDQDPLVYRLAAHMIF